MNEFERALNEERDRREAAIITANDNITVNDDGAAVLPGVLQPRRPDWERSREERRREGHEASTVRNREGYIENALPGIPFMLMDQNVLAHARNTAPMQTELGSLGALHAARLVGRATSGFGGGSS